MLIVEFLSYNNDNPVSSVIIPCFWHQNYDQYVNPADTVSLGGRARLKFDEARCTPEMLSLTPILSIQKRISPSGKASTRHRKSNGTLPGESSHSRHSGAEYHNRLRARDNEWTLLVCNKANDLIGILRVEIQRLHAAYITRPLYERLSFSRT